MKEKIYYVYRHVRLDTNEVFYVGKGTVNQKLGNLKTFYSRAFYKGCKRNSFWKSVVNKTPYSVEVLFQSIDEELVFKKEIEFIKLYGRRDLCQGTLVNFNNGGRDGRNKIIQEYSKIKMRKNAWIKGKFGSLHPFSKKLFVYKIDGTFYKEYPCMSAIEKDLKISDGSICSCLSGKCQQSKGFVFKRIYEGDKISISIKPSLACDPVLVFDLQMNLIREFPSINRAAIDLGTTKYYIAKYLDKGIFNEKYILQSKILR